jgi:nucleotide-binding universal stress UspA family protein
MPPTLRWALARLPISETEAKRLAQEAYDEHGFVAGLERVLVDADGSPSGRLASQIVGLLAGPRGLPVTVLQPNAGKEPVPSPATSLIEAGASLAAGIGDNGEAKALDITQQTTPEGRHEAVLAESQKGYDLLAIGLEPTRDGDGAIAAPIGAAMTAFAGPRLIVAAKRVAPFGSGSEPARILVPVKGTEASRRAAELACALAQGTRSEVHALYVVDPAAAGQSAAQGSKRRLGRDIMTDLARIAGRYEVPLHRHLRVSDARSEAVMRQAARNRINLILLGTDERPSDALLFGTTAAALLDQDVVSVAVLIGGSAKTPEQPEAAPDPGVREPSRKTADEDAPGRIAEAGPDRGRGGDLVEA